MDSTQRARTKLRKSCEGCRDFKIRCQQSSEKDGNRCQRCVRERRKCVYLEAKPRPKRAKNARLRVDEMEQKLGDLLAIVANSEPKALDTLQGEAAMYGFSLSSESTKALGYSPTVDGPKAFRVSQPLDISGASSFVVFDDLQDVIARGIVTFQTAEESLKRFRANASTFPFIIIPSNTSLDLLRRQKPFLLLAIIAVGTTDSLKRQKSLDQELRDTIGKRVFMSGERSVDLLQGLLVYLTWHHLFFEPDNHQIYQLCQLAVSMAIDLEITTRKDLSGTTSESFDLLSVIAEGSPPARSNLTDFEAKRAYLGCYYISSTLCIGLRKPNNMKHTNYTEMCCHELAASQEFETDNIIPYFISMQNFADNVNEIFDYNGRHEPASLEPLRVDMLVRKFKEQLTQLERTFPAEVWKHDMLIMTYYNLRTFVNEVGFHHGASDQSTSNSWLTSVTRTDLLMSCLGAAKDYLNRYIALPTETLFTSSFTDYAKLIYNVLILRIFAAWPEHDNSTFDAATMRSSTNMPFYMQALVHKFEDMGKISRKQGVLEDYSLYITRLFRIYEERARDSMGTRPRTGSNMSVLQMLPSTPFDLGTSSTLQSADLEEDRWADILIQGLSSSDILDTTDSLFT